jgi:hypothetical protein
MRKTPRGTGPFVSILISMLRIAVPLIIIAIAAVWILNYQSITTGSVRVTTSVPGADIYIAGVQTSQSTDAVLTEIPTGRQLITVRKPGYVSDPEVAIVEVLEDRIANASFVLTEAHTAEKVDTIAPARPIRQEIFSTGEPVNTIPPAPPARRIVKFEDNYVSDDYSVNAVPDRRSSQSNQSQTVQEPMSSTNTGRMALTETQINVTSNPADAVIVVNSAPTPHRTPYTFSGLDRGVYTFGLVKDGYEVVPAETTISLTRSGQSELVDFNLRPDDSWPRPVVRLSTEPLAAGLLLDGVQVGVGQADVELEFGRHEIGFAQVAGYQSPAPIAVDVTPESQLEDVVGSYIRVTGNAFLAVVPGANVTPFDGTQLRIYVDNELILDGHDKPYDLTLVGSLLPGKRLIRIEYGDLTSDIQVSLSDGDVAEVNFRVESFFSKKKLKLKEQREVPLESWQSKYRNQNILSLS